MSVLVLRIYFCTTSRVDLENGFKLIVPSPTMIVRGQIQEATRLGESLLLTGYLMGGGPCAWAAEDHVRAGLPVYATPEAARTFNDDLEAVQASGVQVVSQDEADRLPDSIRRLELRDFDFEAIRGALAQFGVALDRLAAVAVAVFDHGDAPPKFPIASSALITWTSASKAKIASAPLPSGPIKSPQS